VGTGFETDAAGVGACLAAVSAMEPFLMLRKFVVFTNDAGQLIQGRFDSHLRSIMAEDWDTGKVTNVFLLRSILGN
jgi:hypothetical protein